MRQESCHLNDSCTSEAAGGPTHATRPEPLFGLLADSLSNGSVSCRSSANHAERELFSPANAHSVPTAAG